MAMTPIIASDQTEPAPAVAPGWWRALRARPDTRALGWRLAVAALFVIALVRLLDAYPLPHSGPAARFSLPGIVLSVATDEPAGLPALPRSSALLTLPADQARASNAAVPVQPFAEIAPPYRAAGLAPADRQRAADCLAAAIWYEAGDNPPGERAVAQVVLNRARHPAFPKSVCGVVFQDADQANACQFTFACDGSLLARQPGAVAWARARAIAFAALNGAVDPAVGLATHYHADYVVPQWRDSLIKLGVVGPHLFYRWPGYWGTLAALHPRPGGMTEPQIPALAPLSQTRLAIAGLPALLADDSVTAAGSAAGPTTPTPLPVTHATPANSERLTLSLDPAAFPGSYAVRAYALCKDHPRCLVIGHTADAAPAFAYVQDTRKGVQTALWNCARTPRPDPAQCLPDAASLARMLAGW
jgi:spore germination cell wall hydrolase CwlJ-like protein